jgi:hypothetical protein
VSAVLRTTDNLDVAEACPLNPRIKSAVWAGGLVAMSLGVAYLLTTLNFGSLAQLAAAPLLPFILAGWAIEGGPHGTGGGFLWWLIYPVSFLVWWAVIDLCLRLVFSQPRLHLLGALAVPAGCYVLVAAFMFVVPRFRAIEVDPIPERTDVRDVCRIAGKWLGPFGSGNHAIVGDAARLALLSDTSQNHWLLHSTDCTLQEVKLPSTAASERIEFVTLTNGGEILFAVTGARDLPLRYVLFDVSTGKTSRMPQPEEAPYLLRFSSDARWAAWIVGADTEDERVQGGFVERLEAGFTFTPSARFGLGSYDLVDVAPGGREILLRKYPREYLLLDPAGSLIWAFRPDDGVLPFPDNVRLARDGKTYLAWDGNREHGRNVVQWRINDQLVRKELPDDSTVFSAAVSSDWKWIAASSQTNTKAGRGIESVTVWSRDGSLRFHKRLREGTRTPVVFLDENLLAYREVDEKWQAETRVVRLSELSGR